MAPEPVGIEKIQKCLNMSTERIDYNVQNDIPMPIPLFKTLRNGIIKSNEFMGTGDDKAVMGKSVMVLTNSEYISRKYSGRFIEVEEETEDENADLQKEQLAEEEVLQEEKRGRRRDKTVIALSFDNRSHAE